MYVHVYVCRRNLNNRLIRKLSACVKVNIGNIARRKMIHDCSSNYDTLANIIQQSYIEKSRYMYIDVENE